LTDCFLPAITRRATIRRRSSRQSGAACKQHDNSSL